jgi:hypothetical protein
MHLRFISPRHIAIQSLLLSTHFTLLSNVLDFETKQVIIVLFN